MSEKEGENRRATLVGSVLFGSRVVVRALNNPILGYFCSNDNTVKNTPFYRLLVLNIKSAPFFWRELLHLATSSEATFAFSRACFTAHNGMKSSCQQVYVRPAKSWRGGGRTFPIRLRHKFTLDETFFPSVTSFCLTRITYVNGFLA